MLSITSLKYARCTCPTFIALRMVIRCYIVIRLCVRYLSVICQNILCAYLCILYLFYISALYQPITKKKKKKTRKKERKKIADWVTVMKRFKYIHSRIIVYKVYIIIIVVCTYRTYLLQCYFNGNLKWWIN